MTRPGELWRLFVAVPVPPERLAALAAASEELRDRWPQARWIPPGDQHVTLRFLGATPLDLVVPVGEVMAAATAAVAPGDIALKGFGAFPSATRARVLWAGIDDPPGTLTELAARLDDALEPVGFEREQRAYTPHLTLARFKDPVRVADLPSIDPEPEPFEVTEAILFRSHTSSKGARYEPLASYPLRG